MTTNCDFFQKFVDISRKLHYICIHKQQAKVAQLVERNLAKVEVASSNLVFRSENPFFLQREKGFIVRYPPDAWMVELVDTQDLKSCSP